MGNLSCLEVKFINTGLGIKRGEAPLTNSLPSPLHKGRGIKGEGLVNYPQSKTEYQTI